MTEIQQLIQITANGIIDRWAREANDQSLFGTDRDMFIGDKLDELEATEPEVATVVSKVWLSRMFGR